MIGIRLSNESKGQKVEYELPRLDINDERNEIPDQEYEHILNMPAADLFQICKNSKNVGGKVMEITSHRGELVLSVDGSIAKCITHRQSSRSTDGNFQYEKRDDLIYHGRFNLEKLIEFTKCANLSNSNIVRVMLRNDYPIIFYYPVAALGQLKLVLSSLAEEE